MLHEVNSYCIASYIIKIPCHSVAMLFANWYKINVIMAIATVCS